MIREIEAKTILNKKKKRDAWFLDEYTLNPYSACSFNCLYCYIRGSKYGTRMEERLTVKKNAAELLGRQLSLRAKKKQFGFIVLASATDPYLQVEKELNATRTLLEIILRYRFPVHIVTKSSLVQRDMDLLSAIGKAAILPADLAGKMPGCIVTFSFSVLDEREAKIFEPGATLPAERLLTLEQFAKAGFTTGVSMMPLLPFISDTEEAIDRMLAAFRQAGAQYVMPSALTLFGEGAHDSKTLILNAIQKHYPQFVEEYKRLFSGSSGNLASDNYYRNFLVRVTRLLAKHGLRDRVTA